MTPESQIKQQFVQDFGERYQNFGLSKLMGRIVGLLIYEEGPLSLDEIAGQLQCSKGPVSQITRRLNENGLIRKVWVPGSRRDHYAAEVVSESFRGKSRVQQHQMVYKALRGNMGGELHALALQTSAPK